ncbi:MAG TPA: N-acetyltransferase [Methanomicrobia archaeon]|nr:N-acetyltransferase [Methanomicrobia archaeon]
MGNFMRRRKARKEEEVSVRNAAGSDLREIVRLWQTNIKTANTAPDIADFFYSFKIYFFVAVCSGSACSGSACSGSACSGSADTTNKIVGFVGGTVRNGSGHDAHISGIAVEKEHRRRGIGTRLLTTVEREFRADGFGKVTLEVRKSNRAAINFYEKQGYKRSYFVTGYYADGEDAIVCEKRL